VIENIINNVLPTSHEDTAAMLHDIDYLKDGEKFYSDYLAWRESGATLQGAALFFGLTTRSALDALAHILMPFTKRNFMHFEANKSIKTTNEFLLDIKAQQNICNNLQTECDFVTERLVDKIDNYYINEHEESFNELFNLFKKLGPEKFNSVTNLVLTNNLNNSDTVSDYDFAG